MKITDKYGEDRNSSDMNSFSISEKIGFASPAITTFQISGKISFCSMDLYGFYLV